MTHADAIKIIRQVCELVTADYKTHQRIQEALKVLDKKQKADK